MISISITTTDTGFRVEAVGFGKTLHSRDAEALSEAMPSLDALGGWADDLRRLAVLSEGDKVRLTGREWHDVGLFNREVEIEGVDSDGPYFTDDHGRIFIVYANANEDWSATKVGA